MPVWRFWPRGDPHPEVIAVVQYEVPDLTGNMMEVHGELDQLVWYGPIGVGQVQPQDSHVASVLMGLSD